jgi:hypothetical protein
MGKKDVIKPGHFKLAGRVRPGKDTVPEGYKQDLNEEKAREEEFAEGTIPMPGMKANRRAAAAKSTPGPNVKRGKRG